MNQLFNNNLNNFNPQLQYNMAKVFDFREIFGELPISVDDEFQQSCSNKSLAVFMETYSVAHYTEYNLIFDTTLYILPNIKKHGLTNINHIKEEDYSHSICKEYILKTVQHNDIKYSIFPDVGNYYYYSKKYGCNVFVVADRENKKNYEEIHNVTLMEISCKMVLPMRHEIREQGGGGNAITDFRDTPTKKWKLGSHSRLYMDFYLICLNNFIHNRANNVNDDIKVAFQTWTLTLLYKKYLEVKLNNKNIYFSNPNDIEDVAFKTKVYDNGIAVVQGFPLSFLMDGNQNPLPPTENQMSNVMEIVKKAIKEYVWMFVQP